MADIRIKIAKDKAELVKSLRNNNEDLAGPFHTYVDIIAFSASFGIKRGKYIPVIEASKRDPDPIPQEHFFSKGYDQLLNLIAIVHTKDPQILSNLGESEKKRIEVFEAYANGGLSVLSDLTTSSHNKLKSIMLLLLHERRGNKTEDDLDLSFLEG
jgi:dnd system-associated protein 4